MLFQDLTLPHCVHRLPIAIVLVGIELAFDGQPLQWVALPNGGVASDIVKDLRGEDKKTAIDHVTIGTRLLVKGSNFTAFNSDRAEPTRRADTRDSGVETTFAMMVDQCVNVDVGEAVSVGQAERLVVFHPSSDPPDAAAGLSFLAGFDQRHLPWRSVYLVGSRPANEIELDDWSGVQQKVGKVLLDHMSLVAQADNEVGNAEA